MHKAEYVQRRVQKGEGELFCGGEGENSLRVSIFVAGEGKTNVNGKGV